jgi:hypothetical protein
MSFRDSSVLLPGDGGTGDDPPPHDPGDDGEPGGSCWNGCGRDAMKGKRLCSTCAQTACATCGGYGIVSWIEGGAFVSGPCPDCDDGSRKDSTP